MAATLELLHYWRSSCSWRVRWALEIKSLRYKSTPVDLIRDQQRTPPYLKLNPNGNVPTLLVDGQPIFESLAIIEWLEETYPDPALLPGDRLSRARVRELAYAISMGIQPIQNLKVLQFISSDPAERQRFARHWIQTGLSSFEASLRESAGRFCVGDQVTLADLCLIPQVYNAVRFEIDVGQFPLIQAINDHCLTLEQCQAAAPAHQPGAPK